MPFASLERPSMALGLLATAAEAKGIAARCVYPTFDFAKRIGLDLYRSIADEGDCAELVGEWIFSEAAFPDHVSSDSEYLDWALRDQWYTVWQLRDRFGAEADLRALLRQARAQARGFIEEVAGDLLAANPRIVGCTSVFQQHCASLALLRRLKAARPSIVTLLGGGNCEGVMADVAARRFPWVDYVVSGEADLLFPDLCRLALEDGDRIPRSRLPPSVVAAASRSLPSVEGHRPAEREIVETMDALPVPNFDDYFEVLSRHADLGIKKPTLLIETSRGCWYGMKRHCTFCGLNGGGMKFRSKSPDRVMAELALLSDRYGINRFEAVDNILDFDYFKTLLPRLSADKSHRYSIFFETKSNLREHHVALLAAAGVDHIQPGIESFHDQPLRLLDKGNTGAQNVALLKFAQEYGVSVTYNVLYGIPSEDEAWYIEMAKWLPRIFHLEPPRAISRVRFDRFSPFHSHPDRFGIHLEPNRAYGHIYPLSRKDISDLAYFFDDYGHPDRGHYGRPAYLGLWNVWLDWMASYNAHLRGARGSMLMAVEDQEETTLLDRRPGASRSLVEIHGLAHAIHKQCRSPQVPETLYCGITDESPESIDDACSELIEGGFLINVSGKLVTLAPRATTALMERAERLRAVAVAAGPEGLA
jgi:magnesium-protoporphyrin IX monomethyl ester (oxidative) cyclase